MKTTNLKPGVCILMILLGVLIVCSACAYSQPDKPYNPHLVPILGEPL
jgi:hypothetical protein